MSQTNYIDENHSFRIFYYIVTVRAVVIGDYVQFFINNLEAMKAMLHEPLDAEHCHAELARLAAARKFVN